MRPSSESAESVHAAAADTGGRHGVDFCTLGMFIIDEIHYLPPKPPQRDILGGAGTYAAIGARIVTPLANAKSISWIVDAGNDFPSELRNVIDSWGTSCMVRETPWRQTTRAWNGYDEHESRSFKYLTEKLQLDAESLDRKLLASKSYHLICSPGRALDLIGNITQKRRRLDPALEKPLWVWEPLPDSCVPEQYESFKAAMAQVDIISPNHSELCRLFGVESHDAHGNLHKAHVEWCTSELFNAGVGVSGNGSVVIRAGKDGCLIARRGEVRRWVPAFHTDQEKVVDPTGGGNAFCGALAVTYVRHAGASIMDRFEEAVVAGSVAASFAIEQVGMPLLSKADDGRTLVNGVDPQSRLQALSSSSLADPAS